VRTQGVNKGFEVGIPVGMRGCQYIGPEIAHNRRHGLNQSISPLKSVEGVIAGCP